MAETILERTIINQEARYKKLEEDFKFKIRGHKHEATLYLQAEDVIKQLRTQKDFFCFHCQQYKQINLSEGQISFNSLYLCHTATLECSHDTPPIWKVSSCCSDCLPYIEAGWALESTDINRARDTKFEESKNFHWVENEMKKKRYNSLRAEIIQRHRFTETDDGAYISFWYNNQEYFRKFSKTIMDFVKNSPDHFRELKSKAFDEMTNQIISDEEENKRKW